jgi:hypothetical protein
LKILSAARRQILSAQGQLFLFVVEDHPVFDEIRRLKIEERPHFSPL